MSEKLVSSHRSKSLEFVISRGRDTRSLFFFLDVSNAVLIIPFPLANTGLPCLYQCLGILRTIR